MSTNKSISSQELDLTGAAQAISAGFPDPAGLARLAMELYQEVHPSSVPGTFPGVGYLPTPGVAPPLVTAIPSDFSATGIAPQVLDLSAATRHITESTVQTGTLTAEPGTLSNSALLRPETVLPVSEASIGSIPGGISTADFSVVPSFSFLEDARSIFEKIDDPRTSVRLQPVPAPTKSDINWGISALAETQRTSIPKEPLTAVSTPHIPGAVLRNPEFNLPSAFGFLDQARSISSSIVSPELVAVGNDSQVAAVQPGFSLEVFDVQAIRRDFPILQERVQGGRPLIWLDNAATTQKPKAVIDRLTYFYEHENSNVHRAAHTLAARSTDAFDAAREKVRRFLNAGSTQEIIFVRGATEGINLVAKSWGRRHIREGDEIVLTHLEHHANIVPWQMLCAETGARLRVAPVDDHGQVLLEEYEALLGPKTRLVALAHVSNALGTITPVRELVAVAHRYGAKVLVDGAQAVSHMQVDVQEYDCDFYVFSGHKVFAPTGIGVVYGKSEVLNVTPPWQGGGNMIVDVTFEKTAYHLPPFRFEAGTGSIADAVGLGAAIDYLDRIGMEVIARYEHDLLVYATKGLQQIPGLHLIGTAREKASVLSFVLDGFTTEEVGQALNQEGIAVRAGHHCAQPILRRFGLESTVRPSLAFYNTCEEVDALVTAIWNLKSGKKPGLL